MVQVVHQAGKRDNAKDEQAADVLAKLRATSIEEQAASLATSLGFAYIDLHVFPVDTETLALVPENDARRLGLAVFHKKALKVLFALTDPRREETLAFIKDLATRKGWEPETYVVSQPSMERAWEKYAKRTFIDNLDLIRVELGGADLERFEKDFGELVSLKEHRSLSTSRAMEIILAGAKKLRASDIHMEPEETGVRLRYRIDGVLQDIGILPPEVYRLILSRIKMIGKMRLNIRKEAQDGHFFIELEGKRIDIRVNSIPGRHGESINMRLLSGDDIITDVEKLGLRGLAYEEVMRQVAKPNGMVLNTGPTGSGKTTTLYTLLNHINHPDAKIITVEDPIEYSLKGIMQTEVSKDKTYTFATALRAVVRQDPDVILVGEIRDEETADIAVNAALTGHLVFSTLHANSAPAAIPRMLELGVRPSLITSSVNALIAQRLVRILCEHCKEAYQPARETIESVIRFITIISPKAKVSLPSHVDTLWRAKGCPQCGLTGFHGRIGIFEVMTMTPEIVDIINDMGIESEILKATLENGMITMTQDGILKALEGITTLEEVWRVTDQTDMLQNIYTSLMPNELSRASHVPQTLVAEVAQHIGSLADFDAYAQTLDSKLRLQAVFAAGIALKAGDIHVEPAEKFFDIRLRLDGILQTATRFPLSEFPGFIGEIKLLGGLKSGEVAGVRDSRFSISLEKADGTGAEKSVDVRLSIILGGYGETAVLRLLNQSSVQLDLEKLSIRDWNLRRIYEAIEKPYGIILTTGPTGSGKSTVMYSVLTKLNTPDRKIITVEDPIEYQLPGLLQTQVNEEKGYTFATALRALLRQNPDILMIGEIRDEETAQIAVQAANTGHLVFTTLHANSAASTVSRLFKMGVSGDDLANAATLFMAQRLARKLCEHCKTEAVPTAEEQAVIDRTFASISKLVPLTVTSAKKMWKSQGCEQCNGTGYTGQLILSEMMTIDREVGELIARGALAHEIEEKAVINGMLTIAQDGILAVLEGRTSLDEVQRVTDL